MVHSRDALIPGGDLSALIALLEAAETGSRELDAEVAVVTRWPPIGNVDHWVNDEEMEVRGRGAIGFKNLPGNPAEWSSPHFTTSLDAALALAERVLPGFTWRVQRHTSGMFDAALWSDPDDNYVGYGRTPSPALSLCIAILKAKAQGEGGHG